MLQLTDSGQQITVNTTDNTILIGNASTADQVSIDTDSGDTVSKGDITAAGGEIIAKNTGGVSNIISGNSTSDGLRLYYDDASDAARIMYKTGNNMAFDINNVYTYKTFNFTGMTDPILAWGQNSDSIRYEDSAAKTEFYNGSSVVATVDHDQGDLDIEGRATIGSNGQTLTMFIPASEFRLHDGGQTPLYDATTDIWATDANAERIQIACPLSNMTPGTVVSTLEFYFGMSSTDTQDLDLYFYRRDLIAYTAATDLISGSKNLHDASTGMTNITTAYYEYEVAVDHTVLANNKYWIYLDLDDGNAGSQNIQFHGVRVTYKEVKY